MDRETVTLSKREWQRVGVISQCVQGNLACARAAELLDLSPRHVKRLQAAAPLRCAHRLLRRSQRRLRPQRRRLRIACAVNCAWPVLAISIPPMPCCAALSPTITLASPVLRATRFALGAPLLLISSASAR